MSYTPHFQLMINGARVEVSAPADRSLLDLLRDDLKLTGTKRGCDIGACGSCTVLIDGEPRRACRLTLGDLLASEKDFSGPRSQVFGPEITTIEGLSQGETLHPLQQAFIDYGAIQCGFCTPGMVLAAKALLDRNPHPSREEIKRALAGNLCRCTGYQQIFEAIEAAAAKLHQTQEQKKRS